MDSITLSPKVQVAQKLRRLVDVVAELEEAGVRIIKAECTTTAEMDNVLLSLHEPGSLNVFLAFMDARGLDYALKPLHINDPLLTLSWDLTTIYKGVKLQGFLSDEEKAELEKKGDNDEIV